MSTLLPVQENFKKCPAHLTGQHQVTSPYLYQSPEKGARPYDWIRLIRTHSLGLGLASPPLEQWLCTEVWIPEQNWGSEGRIKGKMAAGSATHRVCYEDHKGNLKHGKQREQDLNKSSLESK